MLRRYLAVVFVSLVLGVLVVFQFRTTNQIEQSVPYDRAHELTVELRALAKERAGLEAKRRDLEEKLARARLGYAQAEEAIKAEVKDTGILAGVTPMVGPGVRVVVSNRGVVTPQGAIFGVCDEDLLKIVNELRAAGAEVLSINGQRLLSTSEIRLAGAHINVNLQRITPPYEIMAIGDPVALRSSLEIKGGIVETLRDWDINVTVETKDRVIVPAYQGPFRYQYARPVRGPT